MTAAQSAADSSTEYAETDGEDTGAEIEKLKASLKRTKDVNKMVKIFDKIEKLKAAEDGKPVTENAAQINKIRIFKVKEAAQKSAADANERAEKKIAANTADADALAEQEMKRATDAEARTNERSRKTIDLVKTEERKKTTKAQAEADKLAGSLMHFMNVAHEKIFSGDYAAQKEAQEKARTAKSALEEAQESHNEAKLAQHLATTKEATAAEKMNGIMKQIGANPSDKGELIRLAGEAQAAKTEVIATRTAAQAASMAVSEKQEAVAKAAAASAAAAGEAAVQDAKVAQADKARSNDDLGR